LNTGNFANIDLPENLNTVIRNRKIIFVLVVPTIPREELQAVRNDVERFFRLQNPILDSIWGIEIVVFNGSV